MNLSVVCLINSILAGSAAPGYKYDIASKVNLKKNSLIAVCGNARNVINPLNYEVLNDYAKVMDKFYNHRKAVKEGIRVADQGTCPELGDILFLKENTITYAFLVTNLLDKPSHLGEATKLLEQIKSDPELTNEQFKIKLKQDKYHIRDYYIMTCLELLAAQAIDTKVNNVQIVWPKIPIILLKGNTKFEPNKRIKNIKTLFRQFGYLLYQHNIHLTIIGQPEYNEVEIGLCTEHIISGTTHQNNITPQAVTAEAEQKYNKLDLKNIKVEQKKDPQLKDIIDNIIQDPEYKKDQYKFENDLLYKLEIDNTLRPNPLKLCIPKSLIQTVLRHYHEDLCHFGAAKVHLECRAKLYWETMMNDIRGWIAKCETCVRAKISVNKRVMEGHLRLPPSKGDTYAIDILGSIPKSGSYDKILVLVCTYSRMTKIFALTAATAVKVMEKLDLTFSFWPKPNTLISDNAGCFTSNHFQEYLDGKNIKSHFITPCSPQGNLAENAIKNVLNVLRILCKDKPNNWPTLLKKAEIGLNEGFSLTLKERPYFLFHNKDPQPPEFSFLQTPPNVQVSGDYVESLYIREIIQEAFKQEYAEKVKKLSSTGRLTSYKLGDIVYLKRVFVADPGYKLKYPYIGPFRVCKINGNVIELVSLASGKIRRASMRNIKIYHAGDLSRTDNKNINAPFPSELPNDLETDLLDEVGDKGLIPNEIKITKNEVKSKYNLRERK